MRRALWTLLLLAGCTRSSAPPAPPAAAAEPDRERLERVSIPPPVLNGEQPLAPGQVQQFAQALPEKVELRVGMSREELMSAGGLCLLRTYLLPGYKGRPTVEVFQPRDAQCAEHLGKRQLQLVGGKVAAIVAGLDEARPVAAAEPASAPTRAR